MSENIKGHDVLKVQGRMIKGYGIIPKLPMQDQRLTIEAKAIYSYICSYAGAGTTAFPSRDKILRDLKIGVDRYYKHFNLLKKYGYITVEQHTDNTGKFRNNIYTLVEMIEPCPDNKGTEPYPYSSDTDNPCPDKPYSEGKDIKINMVKNINLKNNNLKNNTETIPSNPILSVYPDETEKEKTDSIRYDTTHTQEIESEKKEKKESPLNVTATQNVRHFEEPSTVRYDYTTAAEIVKKNLDYENMIIQKTANQKMLDEIVHVIVSTITSEYKDGYISMGEEKVPAEAVKNVFFKLNMFDIEYFIDCFNRQTEPVIKLTSYIRTSLFRNYGTLSHHYVNRVNVDMPQFAERKIQNKTNGSHLST